eukprot:scaffold62414_cov75-Phaeocystis_antarctica.AAC.2
MQGRSSRGGAGAAGRSRNRLLLVVLCARRGANLPARFGVAAGRRRSEAGRRWHEEGALRGGEALRGQGAGQHPLQRPGAAAGRRLAVQQDLRVPVPARQRAVHHAGHLGGRPPHGGAPRPASPAWQPSARLTSAPDRLTAQRPTS